MVRAATIDELAEHSAARARAASRPARSRPAPRSTIEDVAPVYSHMEHDHEHRRRVPRERDDARPTDPDDEHEMTFSTDMGNVSLEMPSIHPCIGIESAGAVQPPARVRGRVHQRVGRPRRARRRAGDGVDRDRPRDRTAPRARLVDESSRRTASTDDDDAVGAGADGGAGVGIRDRRLGARRRWSRAQCLPARDPPGRTPCCRSAGGRSSVGRSSWFV